MNANDQHSDGAQPRRVRRLFTIWIGIFIGILALILIREFIGRPTNASRGPLRLIITRGGEVQGKPVAFFRVLAADGRRLQIEGYGISIGGGGDSVEGIRLRPVIWPHNSSVLFAPVPKRDYICVDSPTNASVWRCWVRVAWENATFMQRLRDMPRRVKSLRNYGYPFLKAIRETQTRWDDLRHEEIKSELITNTVATQ